MENYLPEGSLLHTPGNQRALASPEALRKAAAEGRTLEATVASCDADDNLYVPLGAAAGVIPRGECAHTRDGTVKRSAILSRVGRPVMFRISELEQTANGLLAVLSRRRVQEEAARAYVDTLPVGDVISAKVTHLDPYGAFCDVGAGICALLPIDCICVSRIPHPAAVLRCGQYIRAVVKNRDEAGRLTLTMKELLGTWEENAAFFRVGDTAPGVVRSVEKYGIFVELTPNLAGLSEYVPGIREGTRVAVFIKSMNPAKMKIKLIITEDSGSLPPVSGLRYFFSGKHMDLFEYAPSRSPKKLTTVFN